MIIGIRSFYSHFMQSIYLLQEISVITVDNNGGILLPQAGHSERFVKTAEDIRSLNIQHHLVVFLNPPMPLSISNIYHIAIP